MTEVKAEWSKKGVKCFTVESSNCKSMQTPFMLFLHQPFI